MGLLDSPCEDEKIEMFLTRETPDDLRVCLRTISRSGLGWYPQKTIAIHPVQLQALEILVKRARAMLAESPQPPEAGAAAAAEVIRLPYFGCPAVTD